MNKIAHFLLRTAIALSLGMPALSQDVTVTTVTTYSTNGVHTTTTSVTNLTQVPNLLATNAPSASVSTLFITPALFTALETIIQTAIVPVTTFVNQQQNGVGIKNSTNYFADVYITIPTKHFSASNLGFGAIGGYNFTDNLCAFIGMDYFAGELWMPSGNLSVKMTIQPLHYIGLNVPWHLTIGALAGVGAACLFGKDNTTTGTTITGFYARSYLGSLKLFNKSVLFDTGAALCNWHNAGAHSGNQVEIFLGGNF